ncbi:MAG: hypothetical protein PUE13_04265, partial [Clostridiales bacterium]|nr:hypothetical protein [Clostridiales bacterium]
MNIRKTRITAAITAAIFVLTNISVFASLSSEWAEKDYRTMLITGRQGQELQKPTARFAAKRIVDGETVDSVMSYTGYDCTAEFPTLTCYVGDTLEFEDLSYDNNGGKIAEWDWQ